MSESVAQTASPFASRQRSLSFPSTSQMMTTFSPSFASTGVSSAERLTTAIIMSRRSFPFVVHEKLRTAASSTSRTFVCASFGIGNPGGFGGV